MLYLDGLNIKSNQMTLISYGADSFPNNYKYAYSNANESNSPIA
ncbi:MAG: hypothetical protein HRU40_10860 [Saprospiraceae bacterium]|nr:hypothetical protein [Saprospiraceae bacterium]